MQGKNKICLTCKNAGHYARMCPRESQRKVNEVELEDEGEEDGYQFDMDAVEMNQVDLREVEDERKYPDTDICLNKCKHMP